MIDGRVGEPRLVVVSEGPLAGRTYPVRPGAQLLGRGAEAGVLVDSPELSRRHAWLRWDGAGASIADAGSRNGTAVNHRRVTDACELRHGDVIRLGGVELRFESRSGRGDTTTASHPAYDPTLSMGGVVHGDAQQAARDINNQSWNQNWNDIQLDTPDVMDELFRGRGLARLLMVLGLLVALAGFGGWMYMIFQGGASLEDPSFDPFAAEIGGLPAPMVAFGAFLVGGIIASIGTGMSRASRERRRELEWRRAQVGRNRR
jgi:hypothetical protein